ncbi:MAG: chloride channel protein [Catenulispora sp.]|nr:chloride channel protein [Catenulispora sp.]
MSSVADAHAGTSSRTLPVPSRRGLNRLVNALAVTRGGLLALALTVGSGAGLGAIVFRRLIETFTQAFSGHADYSAAGHAANPHLPGLGMWFVLFAPAVAGAIYGPLVYKFAPEARGHGVPEVMYAVARKGGRIAPQVAVVKSLASALCIGSGGSVGREGPIVQIGSALGSTLGRVVGAGEDRMRLLVACGAAGGIAATFNAPLAGVFFAMELILTSFAAEGFGMIVLSSVTASVIGRAAFGDVPFLSLPPFHAAQVSQLTLFAALGVGAGVIGVAFSKVLYLIEDACDWAWRWPEWARPAVGGLLLGVVLLLLPEMYGVGYPVLENAVAGKYAIGFLLVLLIGKIAATSVTIGIGGSGGVFAPSLFMGAMAGSAFGLAAHDVFGSSAGPVGSYALVGMGAVFAGAARAPITAVVILFELTGEYSIILPLMAAIVLATLTSKAITGDTIYTLKLRRRGIDLSAPAPASPFAGITVGDVMEPVPAPLIAATPLSQAADTLAVSRHGALPVTDVDGAYLGIATARAVAEILSEGGRDDEPVREVVLTAKPVRADSDLAGALTELVAADPSGLPVLNGAGTGLSGWITHQAVLAAVHRDPA